MLSVIILNAVMPSVKVLSVIILNAVMPSVTAPNIVHYHLHFLERNHN
jgi:hypothetical protein